MTTKGDIRCAALCGPGLPCPEQIRRAVAEALGPGTDWGALEIEIFPGREATLLLIRPAGGLYIKEDAVRFLLVHR